MDARPQRPFRVRTFQDENQPLNVLPGKTIHQRNKSSPALSTLAQAGPAQPLPKRTAFGDVSNTARAFGMVKDDSVLSNKPQVSILKGKVDSKTTTAALQRPAQRPLSVSGLKGFLGLGPAQPATNSQPVVDECRDVKIKQPPAVKTLASKSTTASQNATSLGAELSRPSRSETMQHDSMDGAKKKFAVHVEQEVHPDFDNEQDTGAWIPGIEEQAPDKSNSVLQTNSYLPSIPTFSALNLQEGRLDEVYEDANCYPLPQPTAIRPYDKLPLSSLSEAPTTRLKDELPVTRPRERTEDDAYPGYEAADYTTAQSLKSRGDLTTDPTTIILAPRLTANAERELASAAVFVKQSQEAAVLEEDEAWDTSMVAEYGDDIFRYMRTLEEQMRPNPCYMDDQTEVQWSMRSVLMDWLVQVHHRFGLLPETLFLCVNFIDRFLSCKVVSLGKLQLVGATAIFVAAKYEEINCPSVQEIVYMVDGGYTIDEILKAERFMLSMLQFELGWPGPMSFLRRISKGDDYDLETRTLAKYFLEITIMDERFVGCIPSFTAAGSHCLARLMLKKGYWSQRHVYYSGYTYIQLRPLLLAMLSCCEDAQRHHGAVFDKYSDKRFKRASYFVQNEVDRGFTLPALPRTSSIGPWEVSSQ